MADLNVVIERLDNLKEDMKELKTLIKEQQNHISDNTIELEKLKSKLKAFYIAIGSTGVGGLVAGAAKIAGLF